MLTSADLDRALDSLVAKLMKKYDVRGLGSSALGPRSWGEQLANVAAAGSAAGTRVNMKGRTVKVLMSSHASAKVEIAFEVAGGVSADASSSTGATGGAASGWFPAVPGSRIPAPGGGEFMGFRVRLQANVPASTNLVVLGVDWPWESDELGRFAQVSNGGALEQLMKVLRLDGVEGTVQGADGTTATTAAVGVAGFDGAAYRRLLMRAGALGDATANPGAASPAAALLDVASFSSAFNGATWDRLRCFAAAMADAAANPGAGALKVASHLMGWNGATWDLIRTAVGVAGVGVLRVVPVVTAASARNQVTTAGAASTQVAAANANRKAIAVKNLSAGDCYVAEGAAAAVATGWLLRQYETMTFSGTGAVNVIRSAADVTVCYAEESY